MVVVRKMVLLLNPIRLLRVVVVVVIKLRRHLGMQGRGRVPVLCCRGRGLGQVGDQTRTGGGYRGLW